MSLSSLIETLSGAQVAVLSGPADANVQVVGPRIYDSSGTSVISRGELVLGVNAAAEEFSTIIKDAAAAGAAGVLLKDPPDPSHLSELARESRIALLSAPAAATWDQMILIIKDATRDIPAAEANAPIRNLFALADAVAAMVGAAITIEDRSSRLLAYSNLDQTIDSPRLETILGRGLPEHWAKALTDAGFFSQLLALPPKTVLIADPTADAKPRLAVAIRAGEDLLGFLWAVEGDTPFRADAETSLLEGARLAALHLLKYEASDDLSRRERGALLRELFNGTPELSRVSAELGIALDASCAVVAFQILVDDDVESAAKRARVLDLIAVACKSFRRRVIVSAVGNTIHALFPNLDAASSRHLVGLVDGIVEQARRSLGGDVVAGIGSTVGSLGESAMSRNEADKTLRVLASGSKPEMRTATFSQVRVASVLQTLGDFLADHEDLKLPELTRLAEDDRPYLATLRAFVLESFDIPATARRLHVHPNSVRYRLRRIAELTGLDLGSAEDLLVVGLHVMTTSA